MKPTDVRYFASATAFRIWLEAEHAQAGPTWVAIAKRAASHHRLAYAEALDAALCLGWIDGVVGRIDADHYAVRFSRRRPGSNWSAVNVQRFAELQAAGQVAPAGLAAFEGRDRAVSEDTRAELDDASRQIFQAHPEAWAWFERQPPGYRRQASWFVVSARTAVTRDRRLQKLIDLSARGQRLPGFG